MYFFRTKEMHERYEAHKRDGHLEKGCPLCTDEALKAFTHWKIINNNFPYDRVSAVHHMLVPYRHVVEQELTEAEQQELVEIKHTKLDADYFYILEALPGKKSIPQHFHLHLLVPKEEI